MSGQISGGIKLDQDFEEDLLADSPSRYPRGNGRRIFFQNEASTLS